MNNVSTSNIVRVEFPEPVNGSQVHYFGSLSAIYELFTHEQVGLRLRTLWNKPIGNEPYDTGKCKISKHIVYRIKREKK